MRRRLRKCLIPDAVVRWPSCAWWGGARWAAPSSSGWGPFGAAVSLERGSLQSPGPLRWLPWRLLLCGGCGVRADDDYFLRMLSWCLLGWLFGRHRWRVSFAFLLAGQCDRRSHLRGGVEDVLQSCLGVAPHLRSSMEGFLRRGLGLRDWSPLGWWNKRFWLGFYEWGPFCKLARVRIVGGWWWAGVQSNRHCLCWELRPSELC